MTRTAPVAITALLQLALLLLAPAFAAERWTTQQAHEWYGRQPWLVGANYTPANAINQLEMWQADTFDPATIDKELGWAARHRHEHDARVSAQPSMGAGREGLQAAHRDIPVDRGSPRYQAHVRVVRQLLGSRAEARARSIRRSQACTTRAGFKHPAEHDWRTPRDIRSCASMCREWLAHSLRTTASSRGMYGTSPTMTAAATIQSTWASSRMSSSYWAEVFDWARGQKPVQPLTSGLWQHDDWSMDKLTPIEKDPDHAIRCDLVPRLQLAGGFRASRASSCRPYGRPLLCTEYMARGNGSTFDGSLPLGKRYNVAMYQLGLRRRQDTDAFPLGFMEEALHLAGADIVVS